MVARRRASGVRPLPLARLSAPARAPRRGKRFELRPRDLRMAAAAEAAVRDAITFSRADEPREALDALRDELGMLDESASSA